MDDKIQILVFVVTFAIFIVSAIMQQKKKPNAKNSNIESIVESIFGIPQESPQIQREASQNDYFNTEYNQVDEIQNESFRESKAKMTELVNQEGVKAVIYPVNETIEDNHLDNEEIKTHFDARQAIIYSEIINRKYF